MLELNTNLLAEIGGWPALKEARGLVERGKVTDAQRDGAVIRARVHGVEKIYNPQIILADRAANIEVRCTCAESRRRVCPHILAAGLALLQPAKTISPGSRRLPGDGALETVGRGHPPLGTAAATAEVRRLRRYLLEEAPAGAPVVEVSVLLPLQLRESFAKDPIRIILEGRRANDGLAQPWDSMAGDFKQGIAVSEEDDRVLTALENICGGVSGINAVARNKMGALLRALSGHRRVWIGKKERVVVQAASERPKLLLSNGEDGTLELTLEGSRRPQGEGPSRGIGRATTEPSPGGRRLPAEGILQGWSFDGQTLSEVAVSPPGFTSNRRLVPKSQIPDFLSREFPGLERNCDIAFAPGFTEFQMEIGQPEIEARLEGALSGLMLDLVAHYGENEFSVSPKSDPSAYQRYVPDARQANRFWRRNVLAEREALAQAEAAGFSLVRSGATTFSLSQENNVARFLANTLSRWKRSWKVSLGGRLESTLQQVDIAQPEFSLKAGSGEDWLSLDLKLSVGGQPVPLDQAEIQRWLQTGQNSARTANKRTLLIPTEAWGEMQEVLADCAVEQQPGKIRVDRKYAPFLTGALHAQGFRAQQNIADLPTPDLKAVLEASLLSQLRPYQTHGVEWLASLAQQNLHGLLADDMGLGKTLQALAFAAWLRGGVAGGDKSHGTDRSDGGETVARRSTATTEGGPLRGAQRLPEAGAMVAGGDKSYGTDRSDGGETVAGGAAATTEGGPLRGAQRLPEAGAMVAGGDKSYGTDRSDGGETVARRSTATTEGGPLRGAQRLPEAGAIVAGGDKSYGTDRSDGGETVARRSTATTEGGPEAGAAATAEEDIRRWGQRRLPAEDTMAAGVPALIVCPTSLVTNWLREAARFTPHLRALDLTGVDRAQKFSRRHHYDLLVTSYAILRRDIEQYRGDEFSLVILDEAQHIKNRSSQNAQSAKALRARHRLILTGTPLENSVLDLWSLYDFLLPGYLGTATEFKERYETPLTKGAPDAKAMERLRYRVRPFFLRRTKEEVLTELPPKLEHLTFCELTDEQREVYRAVLAQGRRDVFENSGKQGQGRDRIAVLTTLLRLRQVCCHLDLLPTGEVSHGGGKRWKEPSAKMERTFELIDEAIDGGHRVLLFSQFVRVLHLLRDEAKRREMSFCYLDGQTVERQAEVDRFQSDAGIPLFLISLKAGGTGLNLTGADTVIHFDPWWNPAVEEQATSRAHRMGQARSVQAYKLIAAGTVEEKIQALQARKRELFEASLGGDAAFVEKLTGEDLEELLAE